MPKNTKKAARRRKTQGIEGTDLDASTKEIDVVRKLQLPFIGMESCPAFKFTYRVCLSIFFFSIAIGYIYNFK